MSAQSARRFNRDDFAISADPRQRATVLHLDRVDPADLPTLMDGVLAGRTLWGPWRDSPLRIPALVFLALAAIAELVLLRLAAPPSVGVEGALPPAVAALALMIVIIPIGLWLLSCPGGLTGADAAISLSVPAAEGVDESIDHIRSRWADARMLAGVRQEDLDRLRTLAYNAQVEAAFHLHMRTSAGDHVPAELAHLAKGPRRRHRDLRRRSRSAPRRG